LNGDWRAKATQFHFEDHFNEEDDEK